MHSVFDASSLPASERVTADDVSLPTPTAEDNGLPRTTAEENALPRTTAEENALPRTTAEENALPRTTAEDNGLPDITANMLIAADRITEESVVSVPAGTPLLFAQAAPQVRLNVCMIISCSLSIHDPCICSYLSDDLPYQCQTQGPRDFAARFMRFLPDGTDLAQAEAYINSLGKGVGNGLADAVGTLAAIGELFAASYELTSEAAKAVVNKENCHKAAVLGQEMLCILDAMWRRQHSAVSGGVDAL